MRRIHPKSVTVVAESQRPGENKVKNWKEGHSGAGERCSCWEIILKIKEHFKVLERIEI